MESPPAPPRNHLLLILGPALKYDRATVLLYHYTALEGYAATLMQYCNTTGLQYFCVTTLP